MTRRDADPSDSGASAEPATPTAGELLAALCGATEGLVWFQDREGRFLYANAATLALLGMTLSEIIGRPVVDIDTFEDYARRAAEARIQAGSPREILHGHRDLPDGAVQHYKLTVAPLPDSQDAIAGMVCQVVDETEIFRNSKILEGIGASVPDLVFAKDRDLRFIYANAAYLKATGRRLDEVLGHTSREIWGGVQDYYQASDAKVVNEGVSDLVQSDARTADGVRRIFETRKFPLRANDGAIFGMTGVAADVTEDLDAQAELARAAARLESISNITPNIIWSSPQGGPVDFVNEHWFDFTGQSPENTADWKDTFHPDDIADMVSASRAGDLSGEPIEFECRLRHRDGGYRWLLGRAIRHTDPDDGGLRWTGSFTDIQELVEARRLADLALKARAESEAHLQAILNAVPDPMVVVDSDGVVQAFGAAAETKFGWSAAEMIGRHVGILAPQIAAGIASGELPAKPFANGAWSGLLLQAERKDGSTFPFELSIGAMQSGGQTFYTGFVRDQTERLRAEAQAQALRTELAHLSRLRELGSMASALAHELNQPLAAASNFVNGSVRLLGGPGADLGLAREGLEQAVDQVGRAAEIIRRLREFLDRGETPRRPERLKELIDEAVALALAGARDRQIKVKRRISPSKALVIADRLAIQQVLVHLVRNAVEAMSEPSEQVLEIIARPAAEGLSQISVRDSGPGLSETARRQLFQPFVSTKPNGVGVGLSICRAIIEAHGGKIWADDGAAAGATFHFTLRTATVAAE